MSGIFGKGGGGTPVEAPNTLQSRSVAKAVDLLSEGEVVGLVNGLQSIYFDNTKLQNPDGVFNYFNVVLDARAGLPTQNPVLGFSDVETEVDVSTRVQYSVPVTRTISSPGATSLRVTINIPSLNKTDTGTGNINPTDALIKIEVQPNGGAYAQVVLDDIYGKTTAPYERAYRFALPGASPWNVRVSRLTADSFSALLNNQTYWASYTIIEDWQLEYPNSSYVFSQIDAQSFGGKIPNRTYEIKGIKVQVPANYNPTTRAYATTGSGTTGGVWDGTFQTAWTDNPAWIFYDLIANDRYGLGQFLPVANIDKFGLYTIAQYCDQLVTDGVGGLEPRYIFNGTISGTDDAMKILALVAGVFRGMVYWGSNGVSVVADMPHDPVRLITPANVIEGTINYSGSALKARHSVAHVTWYDPTNFYQQTIEVVEDAQAIALFGFRSIDFVAIGCTSRGRAHRYGRWLLDTEKTATETALWHASWDQSDLSPGDIVEIADPAYAGVDFGGRLAGGATTTTLRLDRAVTLAAATVYSVSVVLPDGTIGVGAVTTSAGTVTSLSVSPALASAPIRGAIWVLSSSALAPRQFRIISRIENDKHLFEFTAVLHDPTKYARIEQGIILETPTFTALPLGPIAPPTALAIYESIALVSGNVAKTKISFSWTAAIDSRVMTYEIQSQPPGQNWQPVTTTSAISYDLFDLTAGSWGFRVRSITGLGVVSPWATLGTTILDGLTQPPNDLTNVRTAYVDSVINIRWDEVLDFRPVKYEIRKGDSWNAASQVGTVLHPPFETHGDGNYWISAYIGPDAGPKIYAVNPSEVAILGSVISANVIAIWDEQATGWTGTFSGTAGLDNTDNAIRTGGTANELTDANILINSDILNGGGDALGYYEIPASHFVNIGRVAPCPINIKWKALGVPINQNILIEPNVLVDTDFLGALHTQFIDVHPEIALAQDGVPTWGPYQKYAPGTYIAQSYKARMLLNTSDPNTIANAFTFTFSVDVPDRTDHITATTVPAVGLPITFKPDGAISSAAFNGGPNGSTVPNVQVTIHDAQAGDVLTVNTRTKSGCTVQISNGGSPVQRNDVDIVIQGY